MRGALYFSAAMLVFGFQDAVVKTLVRDYAPVFLVMIRYWAFAAFVLFVSARRPGGVAKAARSERPLLQIARSLLLVAQITCIIWSFDQLGLAATHSLFALYPLLTAALGAALLGERVDRVGWLALGLGLAGVLIIMRPGAESADPAAFIALGAATLFAAYNLLTRIAGRHDPASVSFFYNGVFGALGVSLVGPFYAVPVQMEDAPILALLCFTGAFGHFLLIKAYEASEAARLQPLAYIPLPMSMVIGWSYFNETIDTAMLLGAAVIVFAGLLAFARERLRQRRAKATANPSSPAE